MTRSRPKLKCFSLNKETKTETKILLVSMTRPRFRLKYSKTKEEKKKLKKRSVHSKVNELGLDRLTNVRTDG